MTDATASSPRFALPKLDELTRMLRRSDVALALGVVTILVVLVLPLPATLLDLALAVSIVFSVMILMTALFIQAPLEFSSFPAVLLIATMLRLALISPRRASFSAAATKARPRPATSSRPSANS